MTLCVSTRQYERKELLLAMHCGLYKSKLIKTSLLPFERKNAFFADFDNDFQPQREHKSCNRTKILSVHQQINFGVQLQRRIIF